MNPVSKECAKAYIIFLGISSLGPQIEGRESQYQADGLSAVIDQNLRRYYLPQLKSAQLEIGPDQIRRSSPKVQAREIYHFDCKARQCALILKIQFTYPGIHMIGF